MKCRNQGGTWQYFFMCDCGYRDKYYLPHRTIRRAGIDPIEVPPARPRHRCEVCGADGAELHHWAPTAIFGSEADRWPTSYLCPACHRRWHRLVTPMLTGRR